MDKHVSTVTKPIKVPGPDHPITIDLNPNRVVISVAGRVIADTHEALTLREASYPAVQYIPRKDVDLELLQRTDHETTSRLLRGREIGRRRFFDAGCLRHSGIGDEDIEPVADNGANLLGKLIWTVGGGEIDCDRIGVAAGLADLADHVVSLFRSAAIVNENLGAGLGERHRAGAPDAA